MRNQQERRLQSKPQRRKIGHLVKINLPAAVSPSGSLTAVLRPRRPSVLQLETYSCADLYPLRSVPFQRQLVLGIILEISRIFLRFFLRARSRSTAADKTGLGKFILRRCLRLVVIICFLSFFIAGCDQLKKKTSDDRNGVSSNSQSGQSRVEKRLSEPCKKYEERICQLTGVSSLTCFSIKNIVSIVSPSLCRKGMEEIGYTENKYAEKRKVCTEMVEKVCNEFGPDSRACAIVGEDVPFRTPDYCRSTMKRYPEMVANLRRLEEVRKPLTPEKQKMIAGGTANRFGSENAKVTIVSFLDFQSPYSAQAAKLAQQIKDKYGDKVRFVFRHFPDSFHPNAYIAAQASLAAAAQGKFWEYQKLLFENQDKLARTDLERYARKLKLNIKAFKKALDEGTFKKAVDADIELGKLVYVSDTPTSYLNGENLMNPTHFNLVAEKIDEALK